MTARACPGCGAAVPITRYACPVDWHRLPSDLKRAISIAYGRYRTLMTRGADWADIQAASYAHDAAKAAADAWLKANPR